jgi:hypothetical protein
MHFSPSLLLILNQNDPNLICPFLFHITHVKHWKIASSFIGPVVYDPLTPQLQPLSRWGTAMRKDPSISRGCRVIIGNPVSVTGENFNSRWFYWLFCLLVSLRKLSLDKVFLTGFTFLSFRRSMSFAIRNHSPAMSLTRSGCLGARSLSSVRSSSRLYSSQRPSFEETSFHGPLRRARSVPKWK